MTYSLLALQVVLAIIVPSITPVIAISGSTAGVIIAYLFPMALVLKITRDAQVRRTRAHAQLRVHPDSTLGRTHNFAFTLTPSSHPRIIGSILASFDPSPSWHRPLTFEASLVLPSGFDRMADVGQGHLHPPPRLPRHVSRPL